VEAVSAGAGSINGRKQGYSPRAAFAVGVMLSGGIDDVISQ
jgi:hypothetical protein